METENFTIMLLAILLVIGIILGMIYIPKYKVYSRELSGKAQLKEAEWNRQIAIEEAKAL